MLAVARLMPEAVAEVVGSKDSSLLSDGSVPSGGFPQDSPPLFPAQGDTRPVLASLERDDESKERVYTVKESP